MRCGFARTERPDFSRTQPPPCDPSTTSIQHRPVRLRFQISVSCSQMSLLWLSWKDAQDDLNKMMYTLLQRLVSLTFRGGFPLPLEQVAAANWTLEAGRWPIKPWASPPSPLPLHTPQAGGEQSAGACGILGCCQAPPCKVGWPVPVGVVPGGPPCSP